MGIPGLERELRKTEDCIISVSIPDLVEKSGTNVIVVDGFNFYGLCLYPKLDWVCGGVQELVEYVRKFVEAFERVGVKLVFFFTEGDLDAGSDGCGSPTWTKRRSEFIKYTKSFFSQLSQSRISLDRIKEGRLYYNTPFHAQSVVVFALRHILHCEVHMVYAGDRNDAIAYYTRDNNCLGLLAQDIYYVFYTGVPRYLSLRDLRLSTMTTIQYCHDALARKRGLVGHLYPVFFEHDLNPMEKEILVKICRKINEYENADIARKKIMECLKGKNVYDVLELEDTNIEDTLELLIHELLKKMLRHNFGCEYIAVHGPVTKWELIKLRAQELYKSGQMSIRIETLLISKKYYNDCILEDFIELPPSTLIYRSLRQMLYGVLFHEAADNNTKKTEATEEQSEVKCEDSMDSENDLPKVGALDVWEKKLYHTGLTENLHEENTIIEWVMFSNGCLVNPVQITPETVDPNLHPGLLTLWNPSNNTSYFQNIKWQLFTKCISTGLDCEHLRKLPPKLVIPTTVLYYLYNDVPQMFKTRLCKFLQPWEVEVFIAQAVMLAKYNADFLSKTAIQKVNARVVKLNALFVYGCQTMSLLVEACGYPISQHNLCILHFFDGKLTHSFYEKAEWRRTATHLCDRDIIATFQQMKHIILPEMSATIR